MVQALAPLRHGHFGITLAQRNQSELRQAEPYTMCHDPTVVVPTSPLLYRVALGVEPANHAVQGCVDLVDAGVRFQHHARDG
jgi:hypothetical protein